MRSTFATFGVIVLTAAITITVHNAYAQGQCVDGGSPYKYGENGDRVIGRTFYNVCNHHARIAYYLENDDICRTTGGAVYNLQGPVFDCKVYFKPRSSIIIWGLGPIHWKECPKGYHPREVSYGKIMCYPY